MVIGQMSGGLALPAAESNVLQSFSDATAGRSLQLYHCVATSTTGGLVYVLARDSGISYPVATSGTPGSTDTIDFDITINKSTLFSGIGYLDLVIAVGAGGPADVRSKIYHYDGSTETLISGSPVTPNNAGATYSYKIPLTVTKKNFRPGDILRLKLALTTNAASTLSLKHDPLTAGSELKLWVPVVNLE